LNSGYFFEGQDGGMRGGNNPDLSEFLNGRRFGVPPSALGGPAFDKSNFGSGFAGMDGGMRSPADCWDQSRGNGLKSSWSHDNGAGGLGGGGSFGAMPQKPPPPPGLGATGGMPDSFWNPSGAMGNSGLSLPKYVRLAIY